MQMVTLLREWVLGIRLETKSDEAFGDAVGFASNFEGHSNRLAENGARS